MTADLRPCCQQAVIDGVRPEDHFPDCDGRVEDPPQDALFDITPPASDHQGGAHL